MPLPLFPLRSVLNSQEHTQKLLSILQARNSPPPSRTPQELLCLSVLCTAQVSRCWHVPLSAMFLPRFELHTLQLSHPQDPHPRPRRRISCALIHPGDN